MSERPVPPTELERERRTLAELRAESGLKLTPLAARVGVSAAQMSRYIQGDTILPPQMYGSVAEAFGISKIDLIIRLGLLDDEDELIREGVEALQRMASAGAAKKRANGDERAHVAGRRTGT